MPEDKIAMQWEDLPNRLQSEALKCLICSVMQKYAEDEGMISALSHACTYMTSALTTPNNEVFKKSGKELVKHLDIYLKGPVTEAKAKFVVAHVDYLKARTHEVVARAAECLKAKGTRR